MYSLFSYNLDASKDNTEASDNLAAIKKFCSIVANHEKITESADPVMLSKMLTLLGGLI